MSGKRSEELSQREVDKVLGMMDVLKPNKSQGPDGTNILGRVRNEAVALLIIIKKIRNITKTGLPFRRLKKQM